MLQPKIIRPFIGKNVYFMREEPNNQQAITVGRVLDVTEDCIVIDFRGSRQIYDLKTILWVRENREEAK